MRRVLFLAFVVAALVAGPAARLAAASPCAGAAGSAPMDCCAGMGDDASPPCHCSLNPVPPAPGVLAATDAPLVLAEAPLPAVAIDAPAAVDLPAPVPPRARAAPLYLLVSVLLV